MSKINYKAKTTRELLAIVATTQDVMNAHLEAMNGHVQNHEERIGDLETAREVNKKVKAALEGERKTARDEQKERAGDKYRTWKITLLIASGLALPIIGFWLARALGS